MSLRLPVPIAAFAVLCSLAGSGPVFAQSLDRTFLAANDEADAKVGARDRSLDGPKAAGVLMQAAVHRPSDKPADAVRNPGDPSFFSRWLLDSIAGDATPGGIEDAWHARKAALVESIRALGPQERRQVASTLDSLLRTMTAYAFDRGHVRQALADCQEMLASYGKKGGLYARSAWEAQQDFAEKTKSLGLDRNGLVLANDLWIAGGQPLLRAALRVVGEVRSELAPAVPADGGVDAAGR